MRMLVGVQFKRASRIYDFDSGNIAFEIGERVVVETERGLGLGMVVKATRQVPDEEAPKDLKRVVRRANVADLDRNKKNCEREKKAYDLCKRFIQERNLEMKLVDVDLFYDASKAVFHFVAAQRVDFRELVKDLAQALHTRIEMKQMGVRDETKIIGGMGCCGLTLCCTTYLREFTPVNVKMAKEQNLAMNPTKISGVCGRLMCCLAYEHNVYKEASKTLPKKGKKVNTPNGPGRVIDLNVLKQTVFVELEKGSAMVFPADKVTRILGDQREQEREEPEDRDLKKLEG